MNQSPMFDVAVIGGGLAGLTAAIFAGRAGRSVILFERAPQPGGRASTHNRDGFHLNQGPHALYRNGAGTEVLRELGITYSGAPAGGDGSWALWNGEKHLLPRTPEAMDATRLLSEASKLEAQKLFAGLQQFLTPEWNGRTLRGWLDTQIQHDDLRALLEALFRLSTYCDDLELQSAGAALTQFVMGQGGVDYLDGGWQSLVDSLRDEAARAAGVRIETHSAVDAIECDGATATIRLANGGTHLVRSVVATVSPSMLARLVNGGGVEALHRWAREAVPVYASCLDVALRRLPCSENQFVLGLDRPLYFSVHTRSARLAPEGGAVIHLAKYLRADSENNAADDERELEALLDLLQPEWREVLVTKRYLPRMLVSNAIATAAQGGIVGRPGPAVPDVPNLFVAGDWVGPHGMLADTSLASARDAARLALQWLDTLPPGEVLQSELAAAR